MITRELAELLGVRITRIYSWIRLGLIDPLPRRDASLRFDWSAADVERARRALAESRRGRPGKGQERLTRRW